MFGSRRSLPAWMLLLATVTAANAQTLRLDTAEVRTAASAQRSVPPDLATVTLRFAADGTTPGAAGARLAMRADSLRRALLSIGIPRDSVVTGSHWGWWNGRLEIHPSQRCQPRADNRGCDTVFDTTYRARETIEVRIRDMSKVGAVIDTALARNITDISDVRFLATDPGAAQEAALREATQRARRQAEAIAAASGGQLGRVLSLSTESEFSGRSYGIEAVIVRGTGEATTGTVITRPSVPVMMTVHGRWQLSPRP